MSDPHERNYAEAPQRLAKLATNEPTTIQGKMALLTAVVNDRLTQQSQRKQMLMDYHLPHFIQKAFEIQQTATPSSQMVLPGLLKSWRDLKERHNHKNEHRGHLFNPFALIPIGETTHSRLLGDLLNPRGTHGQNRRLLDAFLEAIEVPDPTVGDWMISIEEGYVDLCLWRRNPASVIIIENKSNHAVDQPNQLYRYWYQNIHRPYPTLDYSDESVKHAFQIIYLPPTAEKQPAFQSLQRPAYLAALGLPESIADVGITFKVCSFRDQIVAWLNRCDELIPNDNYRLKSHLQFYKEIWI